MVCVVTGCKDYPFLYGLCRTHHTIDIEVAAAACAAAIGPPCSLKTHAPLVSQLYQGMVEHKVFEALHPAVWTHCVDRIRNASRVLSPEGAQLLDAPAAREIYFLALERFQIE